MEAKKGQIIAIFCTESGVMTLSKEPMKCGMCGRFDNNHEFMILSDAGVEHVCSMINRRNPFVKVGGQ